MAFFLFIILLIVSVLWLLNKSKLTDTIQKQALELSKVRKACEQEKNTLRHQIASLEAKNGQLSRYQTIIDVQAAIAEMMVNAKQETQQSSTLAKEVLSTANREAQVKKERAETVLNNALLDAQKIKADAHVRAQEIAGDAYTALQNAASLEKTVRAMKNIIEGYGNQYIIPTFNLLDDLAEEFSHEQAGQELQRVRERIRVMIKNGTAASCEYAEHQRRETALTFVLDAFNGKVDSIFSSVKRDNYGILEQKIKDAYQVVNNNGKAFRNALITQEYLQTRLAELKWAVVVQELKWQEREEQRLIKEKIREEEKARREYEKAIRETEREEEILRKAIEKAQKAANAASEEQQALYEEKLLLLQDQLKIAEAKNQRALSMAQQTKSGNVYIISNIGSFGENVYKIGMTRRLEPLDRIKELGDASVPFEFDVHSLIYSDDAPKLERELHKTFLRLQMNKVNPRKEFFKITLAEIKNEIEKLGLDVKWTMMAEAREYRESLAIEEEISHNAIKREEWLSYQEQLDPVVEEDEQEAI